MTNLSRHPVLRAIYGASQAIEKCGASRELTDAVVAVTALYAPVEGLLDRIASLERQLEDTNSPARRGSDDVDDEAERLFWCFAAMLDPSQTGNAPLSQRDAFKRAIRPSLCAATKEVNDSLRAQLAERTRERDEARYILAGSDYGSLPNDWTLPRVAEARMGDINKLTWQVRDTCARAESAERALAEARKDATEMRDAILAYADEYGEPFGDDHPLRKVWMRLAAIDAARSKEQT